jgi:hypothetical protein
MTPSDDTESTPCLASPRKAKAQQTGRDPKRLDRKTNEEMANMYRHSFPRSMPETQSDGTFQRAEGTDKNNRGKEKKKRGNIRYRSKKDGKG